MRGGDEKGEWEENQGVFPKNAQRPLLVIFHLVCEETHKAKIAQDSVTS